MDHQPGVVDLPLFFINEQEVFFHALPMYTLYCNISLGSPLRTICFYCLSALWGFGDGCRAILWPGL